MAWSHSAKVNSAKGLLRCSMPALLNAPSRRPYAATVCATSPSIAASEPRSAGKNCASPPASCTARHDSSLALPGRSLIISLAPACANTRHAARPMPPPAPVTRIALPRSRSFMTWKVPGPVRRDALSFGYPCSRPKLGYSPKLWIQNVAWDSRASRRGARLRSGPGLLILGVDIRFVAFRDDLSRSRAFLTGRRSGCT